MFMNQRTKLGANIQSLGVQNGPASVKPMFMKRRSSLWKFIMFKKWTVVGTEKKKKNAI